MPTFDVSTVPGPSDRVLALPNGRTLPLSTGRPLIMGVLNLTPDSFSDGGRWMDPEQAVEHALQMEMEGAELIDLGAESTRPGGGVYGEGADWVPPEVEWERLRPVLHDLRSRTELPLSVDTRKAEVARRALEAGADLINDVSAMTDPEMVDVVAESRAPIILMHSRGEIPEMQRDIHFQDVNREVQEELREAIERAHRGGVASDQVLVDPGIGFGKTAAQNLELLRGLGELGSLKRPIVVGASRKSFIDRVSPAAVGSRLGGSLAAVGWAARAGVAIVRVHDVSETAQFLRIWTAIDRAREGMDLP